MNGILGFAGLLKEPNLTGEEQQKFIRIIEKSGKRMLTIINDIIDIAKIESGQMGISIAESDINEQIEYIYTFFKEAYEGAGLGLSISKAYVEMLDGKIWVTSEIEKGSTFYFTISYNTEKQVQNSLAEVISNEDETSQIKNLKILIAEDDETSDLLITSMLNKISNEVLLAKTGIETVEICRNNPNLDLVLMDIRMPGMGGYEATRHIRQFNKDVIIIAQTAYGLSGDRDKAIDAGCNGYIS